MSKTQEATSARPRVEFERTHLRSLLLANPNYFGTLKDSKLKVVKAISGKTDYEQVTCVGFHPQLSQLEAVVHVKKNTGYSSGLCGGGSPEHVRFYTSTDGGASWTDEGLVSFHAFDAGGSRPLEYGVSLGIAPARTFCFTERLLDVRAILSWNVAPTPNDPHYTPVWGNVLDVKVQVEPRKLWLAKEFLEEAEIKLPKPFEKLAVPSGPIELEQHADAPLAELHAAYKKLEVPGHRYLYPYLSDANLGIAAAGSAVEVSAGLQELVAALKIDIGQLVGLIAKTDGNTDYEELRCVGYDSSNDALIGVLEVKKPAGYSGSLCTNGSREYVAFWVDWGDGAGWVYAGTSSVRVYDITSIPAHGLCYAVFEALSSAQKRKPCWSGPVTARVRAILSWQTPPSTSDPNWVPTWGNREETTIQLGPGGVAKDYRPMLESVSTIPVCGIDQTTGMTSASYNRPFGGVLTITGLIPTAPDISTPDAAKLRYRVRVRKLVPLGSWQTLDNDFTITVIERIGLALPTQYSLVQHVDGDGFYVYREDMNVGGAGWRLVQNRVLAKWITADPLVGLHEIMVEAKDPLTNTSYAAQTIACGDGTTRTNVRVHLDERKPDLALAITGYQRGGGPVTPSAVCDTYHVGDIIHGTYSVSDEHMGMFTLTVQPAAMANGALPAPPSKVYPVLPNLGESGTWTLDTSVMEPCGYVVRLHAWDRTIVNSDGPWRSETFVGFCLKR